MAHFASASTSTGATAGPSAPTTGSLRARPPIRTYDDITALGKEVVAKGFTALKTNIVIPGERARVYSPGFDPSGENGDGVVTVQTLQQIDTLIGTFREAVGPDVGIALDLNYNFKTDGVQRIGKLLEPYRMQWIECDMISRTASIPRPAGSSSCQSS